MRMTIDSEIDLNISKMGQVSFNTMEKFVFFLSLKSQSG